jgi:predicted DNA-binding protein (MmcQ/YjbR family)
MDIDWLREFCLSLPHTTENIQWEDDLVFKIAGKMYAVVALEPADHWLSLKSSPEDFATLVDRPGIVPAPYLARANWVALETEDALPRPEVKLLLAQAHELVLAKLPKKTQASLASAYQSSAQHHVLKTRPPKACPAPRRKGNARQRRQAGGS